jgi:hypothetical protein
MFTAREANTTPRTLIGVSVFRSFQRNIRNKCLNLALLFQEQLKSVQ